MDIVRFGRCGEKVMCYEYICLSEAGCVWTVTYLEMIAVGKWKSERWKVEGKGHGCFFKT